MGQQHESDLVKHLEQLGIAVDISSTATTLTYEQIYTSGSTLEEALVTFLGEALNVIDWSSAYVQRCRRTSCQLVKVASGCPTSTM